METHKATKKKDNAKVLQDLLHEDNFYSAKNFSGRMTCESTKASVKSPNYTTSSKSPIGYVITEGSKKSDTNTASNLFKTSDDMRLYSSNTVETTSLFSENGKINIMKSRCSNQ